MKDLTGVPSVDVEAASTRSSSTGLRRQPRVRSAGAAVGDDQAMPGGEPDEVIVYLPTLVAAFASLLATSRSLSRLAHAS
ncbi:hypothetical protein GCM10010320_67790 [Streptomyces caelestis]|nr:hypothetical protein GCM10010320_67790 [Streptomyces caelestis]